MADKVLDAYGPLLNASDASELGTTTIPFPMLSENLLASLCDQAIPVLREQPSLLRLKSPIVIVGDLHGNLRDLLRIFMKVGKPPETSFLFLGDYVDRGDYSVEVLSLLLALAVTHPDKVFLLRGNHEFRDICERYGFRDEIMTVYQRDFLFAKFLTVMDVLPIAAVLNESIFCVHGGLSPTLNSLSQIEEIKRPPELTRLLYDLMWSDPGNVTRTFCESPRGSGCCWGIEATNKFLDENNLKIIVRAHEMVEEGIRKWNKGRGYTVFSSSNYRFDDGNSGGVLKVDSEANIEEVTFPVISRLRRQDAHFRSSTDQNSGKTVRSPPVRFYGGRKTVAMVTVAAPEEPDKAPTTKPSQFGKMLRKRKVQSTAARVARAAMHSDLPPPGSPHPSETSEEA